MTVYMIAAMSADGFIGPSDNRDFVSWTSQVHKSWFERRTKEIGVVVVDPFTYSFLGNAPLSDRLTVVVSDAEVITTPAPGSIIPEFRTQRRTKVVRVKEDPYVVISELVDKNYPEMAIYGNTSIVNSFMEVGLVDILYLTIESRIFGRGSGLFSDRLSRSISLTAVQQLSSEAVLLTYSVN